MSMTIGEIYDLAIKLGMEADPRGEEAKDTLRRAQKEFEELSDEKKARFDKERLTNPYSDTRILCGDRDTEVSGILAGIDMEVGEVLLADRLKQKGASIDLILAHHPEGAALAGLYRVMHMQEDILENLGVPINIAEGILKGRIDEVERGLLPINHQKAVDAARILGFGMMCVHTPADNMVTSYLTRLFEEKKPKTVGECMDVLRDIPEYAEAERREAALKIVSGSSDRRAGKIFVDMTGGTGGSKEAFEYLADAGVGTIVGMHIGEKHLEKAKKAHINVIIAGHMASDSLGMNLFIDEIESGGISVTACSGLYRHRRK